MQKATVSSLLSYVACNATGSGGFNFAASGYGGLSSLASGYGGFHPHNKHFPLILLKHTPIRK